MSCFVHEKRILCYDMAMLPITPDNAGDAGFLGPSRAPTQKADMGSRARARQRTQKRQPKKSSPQASPETQTQQNTVNSSVLWLGSRQKARKPTGKKQGLRSARASHSKSKTDRTTAQRSAQQFFAVFTAFWRARTQHHRQRLAPKCAKMSLAYTPPIPS